MVTKPIIVIIITIIIFELHMGKVYIQKKRTSLNYRECL